MLQQMREWFRYLKFILYVIIFMFIVWAFASWSGGGPGLTRDSAWAAVVNGRQIPLTTFQSHARRLDSTYQSLLGEQYAQQRSLLKIGRRAIDSLVEQELLHQEAVRQGIAASPREVAEAIRRDPNFQEDGRFIGLDRYRNLFSAGRLGLEDYESQVRRGLAIEKLRSLIEDAVGVSDADIEQEFSRRNQKATVEYVVIDPAKVGSQRPPDDASIGRYYDAHRERYTRGEGRTGAFVLFSPADRAGAQTVSDAEVAAAYERMRATRYTLPDQRRASHILLKVPSGAPDDAAARIERQARSILKAARGGEDFAALARKHSEDGSAPSGGDLGFFGRGQMVKEFEDAAFSLPVGAISDLVRSTYGFHIIKIAEARAGRSVPLEEVREQLREELKMEKANAEIQRRSADLARAAAGGKLEAVARSQGLEVRETGPVHEGDALPGLAASQAVVARMLTLAPGEVSSPVPAPSGQVVVQVTGTAPPEPRPLPEVRARIIKEIEDERALSAVADVSRAAQASGGGLRAVARRLKAELKTQADLARGGALPGLTADPAIEKQIAALAPGAIGEPITTSSGIALLSVKERSDHRDQFDSQQDAIRDSLVRERRDRFYRALLKRLREQGEIVVNEPVIQSIDQG
jgi:peptidyl-prolyl cis-trans isomerase D